MPTPVAMLSASERRVAWAVVRPLATVAWWAVAILVLAWLVRSSNVQAYRFLPAVPSILALVSALVLEYYARMLRPDPAR
ncbi:hypothetical protein [Nocardioides dokdonensis]|uniref:hypothetical protein n=1 Tax=Nocardioides dokdonensis TaxID=450734 RepID=UPI00082D4A62|nr:hypothetical protein [Nocardioides dokdonensis]